MATECKHGRLARSCEICELEAENERLCTVALALCETLRHWYDNGGYECDSKQHQDLEIALGNTALMIGHKAALDAAGCAE